MENIKVNIEHLEKLESPSHLLCFAAGLGAVAAIVTLT